MQLLNAYKDEEKYWRKKSRIKWLRYIDLNTSFFQASIVQRQCQNIITKLKNEQRGWVTEEKEVEEHVVEFYS